MNVQVEVTSSLSLFDRIFEYLDMPQEIVDAPLAFGGAFACRSCVVSYYEARGYDRYDHVFIEEEIQQRVVMAAGQLRHRGL